MANVWDYVKAISETKEDIIVDSVSEKLYEPWVINRAFSLYVDTIIYANEMNKAAFLDHKYQFDYLINSIRRKKRWSKWPKKSNDEDVTMLMKAFSCNRNRAEEALVLLTPGQLEQIRELQDVGGKR